MIFRLVSEGGVTCCPTPHPTPPPPLKPYVCVCDSCSNSGWCPWFAFETSPVFKTQWGLLLPKWQRVSPRVPKVLAGTTIPGGAGRGEGVRIEADQEELKAKSTTAAGAHVRCRGQRVRGARPRTAAPRLAVEASELVSMEQKTGLAPAGAGLSLSGPTCLPLTRLPPPPTPSPTRNASASSQPAQTGPTEGQQ